MIEVSVDLRPLQKAIAQFPAIARQGARLPILAWQGAMAVDFQKNRLSGRSDGDKGLNARTGRTLKGNFTVKPLILAEDGAGGMGFTSAIGFMSGQAARIARVHELGTVGKGGTLPDITPKKGKFLWIPVTSQVRKYDKGLYSWAVANGRITPRKKVGAKSRATAKRGGQQFILIKKARIPPRLGFRAMVAKYVAILPDYTKRIPGTIAKLINKAMKGGA